MHNFLKEIAERVLPVLSESQFLKKGVLTPDEFVVAGDQLVFRCPSWSWASGDANRAKPYLPRDKQFLITRNVPSLCRAHAYSMDNAPEQLLEVDGDDADGWLATHINRPVEDIPDFEDDSDEKVACLQNPPLIQPVEHQAFAANEDIPDFADIVEDDDAAAADSDDEAAMSGYVRAQEPNDNIVATRTYDLTITYDKYYQTPRVWLFGYDENRYPLSPAQIMEDISAEHAHKTVTVETHPHTGIHCVSIHPCRHSHVMQVIIRRMMGAGKEPPRIDRYMFWFLKFMSAVLPTIEYDFTLDADG